MTETLNIANIKKEMDDTSNRMKKYYNFFSNLNAYDNRLFFLTFLNKDALNELIYLFPINFKAIRTLILDKIILYLKSKIDLTDYTIEYYPDSDIFDIFIDINGLQLLRISLYDKDVEIIKLAHVSEIEDIEIIKYQQQIESYKSMIANEQANMNDESITDVGAYAKKMFMPKQFNKKTQKKISEYHSHIEHCQYEIMNLENLITEYYESSMYSEQQRIKTAVETLFQVRK